jgi:hypothetical protein
LIANWLPHFKPPRGLRIQNHFRNQHANVAESARPSFAGFLPGAMDHQPGFVGGPGVDLPTLGATHFSGSSFLMVGSRPRGLPQFFAAVDLTCPRLWTPTLIGRSTAGMTAH